ncbi:hypothetical protein EYZ11_004761 [Aspergillus tanneri]|nr:hypothetical protein EYZ11_004761 [Aspergillus tanneri]
MTSKRIRWTDKIENMKGWKQASAKGLISKGPNKLSPDSGQGNLEPRARTARLPTSRDHITRIPSYSRRLTQTAHARPVSQVTEPQPRQYWLGRFVTLINAFHYEDSFDQPDIATGFGMLSSYSRPLGHSDSDLAGYRIKRAFMVLENVCTTEEAGASLRIFRDEYVRINGDWWML